MRQEQIPSTSRPPLLHDELVSLSAPTQVWSSRDGTMGGSPVHGVFHGDWRFARRIELLVDGAPVEPVGTTTEPGGTVFRAIVPAFGGRSADADIVVERMREVTPGAVVERATVINGRDVPISVVVQLVCDASLTPLGATPDEDPAHARRAVTVAHGAAVLSDGTRTLRVRSCGGEIAAAGARIVATRRAVIRPGDWSRLAIELDLEDRSLAAHGCVVDASGPETSGRPALDRWSARAVADLEDLLLDAGHGPFLAAGAPWHLTLVARDALTAARLLLPQGASVAEGTLRTLAARQGLQRDASTGEEPGRILHELPQHRLERREAPVEQRPRYSGSIDATPLWVVLLHDAWRAGMPIETVRELRTALHSALGWLLAHADGGFLSAADDAGPGRADDSPTHPPLVPRRDGTPLGGRVAVARVQALACLAAVDGAELLDALGDDGASLRAWAATLRRRFRAAFWTVRGGERFPALAVDAGGAQLARLSADLGHLIGTTLLSPDEEAAVARLLLDERLSSGFGLRTMASDAADYWPMAGNRGAIWPVDTAIAIEGLLRAGLGIQARVLAEQLERAADAFHGRMPGAYAGYGLAESSSPIPCPGACCPHSGSAASAMVVGRALGGRARAPSPAGERRLRAVATLSEPGPAPRPSAPRPPAPGPASPNPSASPPEPEPIFASGGAARTRRPHLRLVDPLPPPER